MVPVYEAKMLHHFDHRWATYDGDTIRDVTNAEKSDPSFAPLPRYWVAQSEVDERLPDPQARWLVSFRDIARSTDERTLISTVLPRTAVGHTAPIAFAHDLEQLSTTWSSLAYDYVTRQKIGGTHVTYSYLKQLATVPPDAFTIPAPWDRDTVVADWITERSVELRYTANDLSSFATDFNDVGVPFEWDPARRSLLRAELDAAFFHLYGITRDDVAYILDTFAVLRGKEESRYHEFRTKRVMLEVFDAMQLAIDTGEPYRTILDPAPGHGPRHEMQEVAP